ncbi:unnamed protein product, partial [Angiostrongylus costaricensis]|uniref:Acyl-CoA dehydrogenase n=1 Tax=Angiostrongylus costaricensis TaxID=334426 RepID=A0A0R3PIK6_ANGCS
ATERADVVDALHDEDTRRAGWSSIDTGWSLAAGPLFTHKNVEGMGAS